MFSSRNFSRRRVLQEALAAGGLAVVATGAPEAALAQELSPTTECRDGDEPTAAQIEGPFYKPRSPERANLIEQNSTARLLELRGQVLTRACRPVPRVLIDLWHADEKGDYDNRGFRYRGHIFTDAQGRYQFRTIVPALYPGRTRHYHAKVLSTGRQLLTTQLYFPNEPMNSRDDFFQRELLMRIAEGGEALSARFDFVLDLR
jgi:protocatechuate 3,4-dioxygenase beta subunit